MLSEKTGYYPLTPVNAVIGAVYAIADVIKGMMVKYCDEEVLRKYNETSCYINITSHTAEVRMGYVYMGCICFLFLQGGTGTGSNL